MTSDFLELFGRSNETAAEKSEAEAREDVNVNMEMRQMRQMELQSSSGNEEVAYYSQTLPNTKRTIPFTKKLVVRSPVGYHCQ